MFICVTIYSLLPLIININVYDLMETMKLVHQCLDHYRWQERLTRQAMEMTAKVSLSLTEQISQTIDGYLDIREWLIMSLSIDIDNWMICGYLVMQFSWAMLITNVVQGLYSIAKFAWQATIFVILDYDPTVPILLSIILLLSVATTVGYSQPNYVQKSQRWSKRCRNAHTNVIEFIERKRTNNHLVNGWKQATQVWNNRHPPESAGCDNETEYVTAYNKAKEVASAQVRQESKGRWALKGSRWMLLLFATIALISVDFTDGTPLNALHTVITVCQAQGALESGKGMDHSYDTDSFLIAVDNCASRCITNNVADFIGIPRSVRILVKGVAGVGAATYVGTVQWKIEDDAGVTHTLTIPNTYYQSTSPYRLLSPQHWAQERKEGHGTWCGTYDDAVTLFWKHLKYQRTIPLDGASNIALIRSSASINHFRAFCSSVAHVEAPINETELMVLPAMEVTDDEGSDDESMDDAESTPLKQSRRHPDLPNEVFCTPTSSMTPDDKPTEMMDFDGISTTNLIVDDEPTSEMTPAAQLLAWHYRLGHASFDKIKAMAKRGDLPTSLLKARRPICAACMYGKASRKPWRTKAPVNKFRAPPANSPGAVVAVDQLISSVPGLIGQMRGFITRKRFTATTVFVDHFSGLSFIHNQQSTSAAHTIEAKRAFERYSKAHGVTIKHYHADNGIFSSIEFMKEIRDKGQTISFCAVNAHHQNGRAEKRIRDLQEAARTMMLHAQLRWPQAITNNLWPFAIRMANEVSNFAPILGNETVSPMEMFTQVEISPRVKHSHTFGSPVYVLDQKLQKGARVPKWSSRARVGIYLGSSPRHSRKVALILSLQTGHVSPQFHCVFDDLCDTLRQSSGNPTIRSRWQEQTGFTDGPKVTEDESLWVPIRHAQQTAPTAIPETPSDQEDQGTGIPNDSETAVESEDDDSSSEESIIEGQQQAAVEDTDSVPETETRTRSGRTVRRTQRWTESLQQQEEGIVSLYVPWDVFHDMELDFQDLLDDPIAFAASSNPDILYLNEAMSAPDSAQFEEAMSDEVDAHTDHDHWDVIHKSQVPGGIDILPAVWAFRRKRRIATQEVYKWKARLNVHGGKQEFGVNYWETYSPVVGWSTIRLYLILMLKNKWVSKQVDFVLAFPQADIECDLYMEIPQGFKFEGSRKSHCLKLKKNIYGQKQAGRVWNQYLHDGLIARGFIQSTVDMCVYHRGAVALLLYVDDGIFIGPTQEDINVCFNLLANEFVDNDGKKFRAYKITDEGDLSDYLGVKIELLENGLIKLSQPHLIDAILKDLGFKDNTKAATTPAVASIKLNRDLYGEKMKDSWNYRSVIGKLNFLEKSTRADLSYSVHQCARFSADPKESHAKAIKRIAKYLVGTRDKGIILNPQEHSFDCFVDADFVGNWDRVNADVDPSTAKSRTGYVLMYAGCPIVWSSKLQREIALSTTEAEYNALSESLRYVIHMMHMVDEILALGWEISTAPTRVHCKVFEDNSGALEMSRLPKMRPRTKHINIKMHHFRDHVRKKLISIHKIPTQYQLADIATKPQPEALFIAQRESIMQWAAETMTRLQLALPTEHLRACEIIEQAGKLNEQAELAKRTGYQPVLPK